MLRDYQSSIENEILNKWELGRCNVLSVLPTGAGKTVIMADIPTKIAKPGIAIAHRQELIGQISMAFARSGVHHRIIAPQSVIRFIVQRHVKKLGRSFYAANAPVGVAGVQTFNRRVDDMATWLKQLHWWQTDEAHHAILANQWGNALASMPGARGAGWTATPCRSDRKALGRSRGGLFDHLIIGPTMRELINEGYLCDYRIYGPPGDVDLTAVKVTASGEFNPTQLADATERSHIVGDVVEHYLRLGPGKRGVTFAVNVKLAEEHAAAFRASGVPTAVITKDTKERDGIIDDFEAGIIKQIVNVDVLGEGFDCPGIEIAQFARATASYGLYVQQFGRALRMAQGKECGIIVDHVGNVVRHGLPDAPPMWTLDAETPRRRETDDDIPIRQCVNPECFRVFEGYSRACPYCGHRPPARNRAEPNQVEGNLIEFTPALLAKLRGEADHYAGLPHHAGRAAVIATERRQQERRESQARLRETIAFWAGVRKEVYGDSDEVSYMRFYRLFGVDVLTAQTFNAKEAQKLEALVRENMNNDFNLSD